MSILDYKNKKITIEEENCNNFVTMNKELKKIAKIFKNEEIVKIQYKIEVIMR